MGCRAPAGGAEQSLVTKLHFKKDTSKEKLQPAGRRQKHTSQDCGPREPSQHAQDTGFRPDASPAASTRHGQCSGRGAPFSSPRDRGCVCLLYCMLGGFVGLANCILYQGPLSSPEIHVVAAQPL